MLLVSLESNTIAYPERLGLVQYALDKSPNDPVDYIFNEFSLNRRTKSTTNKFESWVSEVIKNSVNGINRLS